MFKIVGVTENGTVEFVAIKFDGTTVDRSVKAEYEPFLKTYCIDKRDEIKNSPYPENSPLGNRDTRTIIKYKSACVIAACDVSETIGDASVLIRLKPQRAVFSLKTHAAGKLTLAPMSVSVKCEATESVSQHAIRCGGDAPDGHTLLLQSVGGSDVDVPFWCLSGTDKAADANMELRTKKCDVSHKFVHGKGKCEDDWTFEIPIYVNKVSVAKGTELKYYRPSKPQGEKRFIAIPSTQPAGAASSSKAPRLSM